MPSRANVARVAQMVCPRILLQRDSRIRGSSRLVQQDSLYAVLERLAVVATVVRKWAGAMLPQLLWGRSLLYSDRYCSMVRWASVRSTK